MIALDIGCGPTTKPGHLGIDMVPGPNVTHVLNFETDPLPFEDASVDAIFSSHCFEHIEHPANLLREMLRVCKDGATVELWMPYGHSNDAFILGHRVFYNELHWEHFVLHYPEQWTPGTKARYRWDRVRYNLSADPDVLRAHGFDLPFAIRHLNNVAWEFGLFFTVQRENPQPRTPLIEFARGRDGDAIETL